MQYLKKVSSKGLGILALTVAVISGASGSVFAQATTAPDFTTVTDAVDVMGPLTDFATYAAGIIAAALVIAFAFMGVKAVVKWVRSLGAT